MEVFLTIAFTLLFLAAAAIVLFLITIHPIWGIIDVAISTKTTGEKVLWIVVMFILWTLGSLLYGLVFATRPLAVTTRVLVAVLIVLVIVMVTIAITAPIVVDRLRDSIQSRGSISTSAEAVARWRVQLYLSAHYVSEHQNALQL